MKNITLSKYLEATLPPVTPGEQPATDLLGLQDLISKTLNTRDTSSVLYAIAIGIENSNKAEYLDDVINFLLNK